LSLVEQPRKRCRSVEVVKLFMEQFPEIYEELEQYKENIEQYKEYIISLQTKLSIKEEMLNNTQQSATKLQSILKSTIQTGSMTITRSFLNYI